MTAALDDRETRLTRQRYDRVAPVYDALEWMMELRVRGWRRDLWSRVGSGRMLELGVGTGKNIRFYPPGREVVAVDISAKMMERARRKASCSSVRIHFQAGDVQRLPFSDATFDVVVGLAEARRVLKPGGRLLLLEHVLSRRPMLRQVMRRLDTIPRHIWGAHIDRDTVDNVRRAGFVDVRDTDLLLDVVKRIEATAPGA
jgi:phosphatidylethanolamine/phosphatidyl-N-methylethanolamine N-methyltransferase